MPLQPLWLRLGLSLRPSLTSAFRPYEQHFEISDSLFPHLPSVHLTDISRTMRQLDARSMCMFPASAKPFVKSEKNEFLPPVSPGHALAVVESRTPGSGGNSEVGHWFSSPLCAVQVFDQAIVVAFQPPARDQQSPQHESTSPAAPYQTVHAVLSHTAFRHRSLPCMRSPVSHVPRKCVDPEALEPLVSESGGPVAPGESVLGAGQYGHPLRDVTVDDAELPR